MLQGRETGKMLAQVSGWPIGLRSTCAVARVVIRDWDLSLISKLEENGEEMKRPGIWMTFGCS